MSPCCHAKLVPYDHKNRVMKFFKGVKSYVRVERSHCIKCNGLHTGLPEQLTPHKQYATSVIEAVVDGKAVSGDPKVGDYPCDGTMDIWKKWMEINTPQVDGHLKSLGSELPDFGIELLESEESLLEKLRMKPGWLSKVNSLLYNFNCQYLSVNSTGGYPPDFVCDISQDALSSEKEKAL